jgi:hypothetical protein
MPALPYRVTERYIKPASEFVVKEAQARPITTVRTTLPHLNPLLTPRCRSCWPSSSLPRSFPSSPSSASPLEPSSSLEEAPSPLPSSGLLFSSEELVSCPSVAIESMY